MASCGKPSNNTPEFVIGDYRGLEIDSAFVRGEWQARITAAEIVIVDPTGQTWARGNVRLYQNELWLVTPTGTRRGLFGLQNLPVVQVLTWAMGEFGAPPPTTFDEGLTSGKSFVFAKCITPVNCRWHLFQALAQLKLRQQYWMKHRFDEVEQEQTAVLDPNADPVNDPCSNFPDCPSCISAPLWCGWCSTNVTYNGTIPGRNCAGLNTTVTPRFNCSGQFSTINCNPPTTGQTTGSSGSSGGQSKYLCNPVNITCDESTNGTFPSRDVCMAQCVVTPLPPVLQNKFWRGLQIDMFYRPGEWRLHIGTNSMSMVSPDGTVTQGNVTIVAQYLSITTPLGRYQTLWQFQPGPAVDNLSWAWGRLNGPPPNSFDEAQTSPGMAQFWFVACHPGSPPATCDFSK
jgi:hypothetical protein